MALLTRTDRVTHCPYKGDANYFSVVADGKTIENSIWTYETPFPAMAEISGHLAFYPDKVRIEEVARLGVTFEAGVRPSDGCSDARASSARRASVRADTPKDRADPRISRHQEDHNKDIEQEAGDIG